MLYNKWISKALLGLAGVASLYGCGGASTPVTSQSAPIVKTFSDGSGAYKVSLSNGMSGHAIYDSSANIPSNFSLDDYPLTHTAPSGSFTVREQTYYNWSTGNGVVTGHALVYSYGYPGGSTASMMFYDTPDNNVNILSGIYTYVTKVGVLKNGQPSSLVIDTINVQTDFNNNTFTTGTYTANNSFILTGNGTFNSSTNELNSSNLNLSINGGVYQTTLKGEIHGHRSSGILHTNESTPVYIGAFIGSTTN